MKKYRIIVSRYQSVALTIEAESIEKAEEIALEDGDVFFYNYDDMYEIVESSIEDDEDAIIDIKQG